MEKLFFAKKTDFFSFLLKKYLIIVNFSHIILSLNHSIMYVICLLLAKKLASQKQDIAFEENFTGTPHRVT